MRVTRSEEGAGQVRWQPPTCDLETLAELHRSIVGGLEALWRRFGGGLEEVWRAVRLRNFQEIGARLRTVNGVAHANTTVNGVAIAAGGKSRHRSGGRCAVGALAELSRSFVGASTQHQQDPALPPPGYARHDTSDY